MTQQRIKVLMVLPVFPPSFWDFKEAMKLLKLKANMTPTGLATVAAMLPTERFDVLPIIDLNIEPLTDDMIKSADVVMFTAMIVQWIYLRESIAQVKRLGKITVVGGPYATMYPEDVLAMGADHLVLNEAETTLAPFVEDFLAGKAEKIYSEHSVSSRVTVPLTREGKPLLTTTPVPRWDLLKLSAYWSITLQYSRGCPYNCEFCNITALFGHEPRTKTVAQMIAELEALLATGWRGPIFIVDDNFIGNPVQVSQFLPALIAFQKKHGYPFSFSTEASIDLANPNMREVLENMVKAGFDRVFVGIESTDPKVLAQMHKGQNMGDLDEAILTLQKAGLDPAVGIIGGNDDDKPTVCDDLFKFIQRNGIVIPMLGLLGAVRGTRLYDRLVSEGRLRTETSGDNTHRFHFNFVPKLNGGISEETLIKNFVDLRKKIFLPVNYYERCRISRRRRGKIPKSGHTNGTWFQAALKVSYRNLIRHPSWEFAKFMLGTIMTSPGDIREAVTEAIKLEHFKKTT